MKAKIIIFLLLFIMQKLYAQQNQQLDEIIIVDKEAKKFKVSKGKKAKSFLFNYDYYNYYYVLDGLPYGNIEELTIYYMTNYGVFASENKKKANKIYEEWCKECFFDVNIYDFENGILTKLTEKPIVISLSKTKKPNVAKKVDFSVYNLVGTQFVLSITPSKNEHHCSKCATYGISLFEDKYGTLFNTKINKYQKGKGVKYELKVRSKKY